MIIYFVALAFLFMLLSNTGCLDLLQYVEVWGYNYAYGNDTTALSGVRYDYGAGVFATTLVCLFGWVS